MKWNSIIKKLKSCNLGIPILLLFFVGVVVYNSCTKTEESFSNNISSSNSGANDCIIRFFYVDWCGHCKKAKPQFSQFKVNGYPTIIAMINGKEVQYNGPRTTVGLDQWLNSIL
jgi:hypothetical protein